MVIYIDVAIILPFNSNQNNRDHLINFKTKFPALTGKNEFL